MKIPQKKKYLGKYDPQFKIAIAREYLTTDIGTRGLSVKHNVPESTVRLFVKWYKDKYEHDAVGVVPVADKLPQPTDADLRITALQMLIENASKELGIDLVKKFGTKRSDK
jgi:transposase-like protein